MGSLVRFGVSMDAELISAFDHLIERKGYVNRSEAIRDLVREALIKTQWDRSAAPAVAALCLVYDHGTYDLARRLVECQHKHAHQIVSALHVHLDAQDCLEVVVLRGPGNELQRLADHLISTRGVKHGQLVMTASGKAIV